MALLLAITSNPQTWADGVWPRDQMNGHAGNGKYQFTFTFTSSSQGGDWGAFFGRPTGGMWRTTSNTIGIFDTADNQLLAVSVSISNGQTGTFTHDAAGGSLTIAGLTSGNGVHSYTPADVYTAGVLKAGGIDGQTGWTIAGSFSDMTDGDTSVSRNAAASTTADAVVSAAREVFRAAVATVAVAASVAAAGETLRGVAATTAVAASVAATLTGGGTARNADGSTATAATAAANRDVPRTASSSNVADVSSAASREVLRGVAATTITAASVSASAGLAFDLGVTSSGFAPFGRSVSTGLDAPGGYLPGGGGGADADGRTPTTANTQASGSAFYAFVGRPTAINTPVTDNKGNTYTQVQGQTFNPPWAQWELATFVSLSGSGGAGHVLHTATPDFDEATLGWTELQNCSHLHTSSLVFHALGESQVSAAVLLDAPGWVIVDWCGDSGTFGAEGFDWTVQAVGEGPGIGQWNVLDSRIKNHTDGWIQWKRWARYYDTPTTGIQLTIANTLNPNQGAYMIAAAFQAVAESTRSADGTTATGAAVAAIGDRARSAAAITAIAAATAANAGRARSTAAITAIAAAVAANRDVPRSVPATSTADASVAAELLPAGTVFRDVAATTIADAAVAATRELVRGAGSALITGADVAAIGDRLRESAGTTAVAASVAAAIAPGSLPPLPIEVVIPFPPRRPRDVEKAPNPRPITPNLDGRLRLPSSPQCSLVESLASVVDDMRQIEVDLGLRFYQVFSVVVRWSGGERHRGTPQVVAETAFLPVPEVTGISSVARELRTGGSVKRGQIWLRKISPRYTQDDILLLFPRSLRPDEEAFIEVRGDGRDGLTVRDRYVVTGHPERKTFGWEVQLTKQDENRLRNGAPR